MSEAPLDGNGPVTLNLEPDEALVLFELLSRLLEKNSGGPLLALTEHDAEIWALNRLHGELEHKLAAPFRVDYRTLLDLARERLRNDCGGLWPRDDA